MRNARRIDCVNKEYTFLQRFDLQEIDNEDRYNLSRLHYLERVSAVIHLVKIYYRGSKAKILEVGSAQATMSLLLAEEGFSTVALDINPDFLAYSREKYEYGEIKWICGNAMKLPFKSGSFDVIILGELIEHCAYPEVLIEETRRVLKERGILIITTPNADCITNRLSKFSDLKESRQQLEKRQFGPAGEDHLFSFSLKEIMNILPKQLNVLRYDYAGSLILCNHTYPYYRKLPLWLVTFIQKATSKIPVLRAKLCRSLLICVRRI